MIEARDVAVSIGRRRIVCGVDFAVAPGTLAAVIGPNGSGKTTLLKALAGELGYAGSIRLGGRELSAIAPGEAALLRAVLPQSTALAFPFTVLEVVRLGLMNHRLDGRTAAELVGRALADVDLAGFGGRLYQELSGGEQQRVQLARVLVQARAPGGEAARLLLLDEPVSSLDIRHQILVMDIARDFAMRGGSVVAVLHDLNLAAMYADAVLVMRRGAAAGFGSPSAVLTDRLMAEVFECPMKVGAVPAGTTMFLLPQSLRIGR